MKRFILDMGMLAVMLVMMGFHLVLQNWHEVLGLFLLAGAGWHVWLNRGWFGRMTRGRWTRLRVLQTGLGILFLLSFLLAMMTGITISNHVFRGLWMDAALHRSVFIHQLHIASAYSMLILCGMHLGMHWPVLWLHIRKLPFLGRMEAHPALLFWLLVVIGWAGVLGSRLDHVGDRLLLRHIFRTVFSRLPGIGYYLWLLCLIGLYAIAFYHVQRYLQRQAAANAGDAGK